jgi:hypothetical protein
MIDFILLWMRVTFEIIFITAFVTGSMLLAIGLFS